LAVIGLGAIGGSIAWQSRLAGVTRVIGYSPRPAEGVQALKAGAIDELADSAEAGAREAELTVVATPPAATLDLLKALGPATSADGILTDVCSVKAAIIEQALATGLGERFAGAHPLAGTHGSGFEWARPDRFRGCVVYICESGSPGGQRAASVVSGFWEHTLEALPVWIEPDAHDRQLAWTSHLPQATAYALARTLAAGGLGGVSFGSGAKDTTRLAASSPEMWAEILCYNASAVVEALNGMETALAELRGLIRAREADSLRQYLESAQAFRQGLDR
jgi:prephenate dehydrogenase